MLVAKFTSGAWVSVLLIAGIMSDDAVGAAALQRSGEGNPAFHAAANRNMRKPPIVIVPVESWSLISQRAMQFALTLSTEIYAVHVGTEEEIKHLQKEWKRLVAEPVDASRGHTADPGDLGITLST